MKPTITANSATEIKITTRVDEIVAVDTLQADHDKAVQDLSDFETWVVNERAGRQTIIDDLQTKLDAASNLGIVASAVATPIAL